MKTYIFSMFSRGWDITHQQIFNSKTTNNRACNPNMLFDASNDRKYQKVIKTGVQRGIQNPSKIMPLTRKPNYAGREGSEQAVGALKPAQNSL